MRPLALAQSVRPRVKALRFALCFCVSGPHDTLVAGNDATKAYLQFLQKDAKGRSIHAGLLEIVKQYVYQAGLKLKADRRLASWHKSVVNAPADAPWGILHQDGSNSQILMVIYLTCCAPLTVMRYAEDVPIPHALNYISPELVRAPPPPPLVCESCALAFLNGV